MIDNKGKLFGKINVIDLLILVLIIGAISFVGYKMTGKVETTGQQEKIEIKLYAEEVTNFVVDEDKIKEGDIVTDVDRNVEVGKITKIEKGPSVSWAPNSEGKFVSSSREGWSSIIITCESEGEIYENGAIISNTKYSVGHSFTVRAGISKIYLRVYDIAVKE